MSAPASVPSGSKGARGNINGVDRLSSLCDELLHHVMSFLPMPEVVHTSLLSPRWRNLWASTPFIHITYQDFLDEDHRWGWDYEKLEKFWDNLLLLHDGTVCLDEARIFISGSDTWKSCVWIRHAIKHKVRLLHVYALEDDCGGEYPVLDSTAMFPSQHLKRIKLQSLELTRGFFRPLNNDCPVLENLELEDCELCDLKEISSRSLKVLCIIRCSIIKDLLICARNLSHLSILDPACGAGAIVTRDLSSLVAASVVLSSSTFHCYEYDDIKIVDGHHLLDGLSHATTLELHAPLHELAFERSLQMCPVFTNLTSLVLGDWCMAADLYPLLRILQHSSKLKELILKLKMDECSTCKDSESALLSSRCALSATGRYPSLERIKICCREDDPRVGALVQALVPIFIRERKAKISIEGC